MKSFLSTHGNSFTRDNLLSSSQANAEKSNMPRFWKLCSVFLSLFLFAVIASAQTCYELYWDLEKRTLQGDKPVITKSAGSTADHIYAAEKEGLLFSEIEQWFDTIDVDKWKEQLKRRYSLEQAGRRPKELTRFLSEYADKYRTPEAKLQIKPAQWKVMTPTQQFEWLTRGNDPKEIITRINSDGWDELFITESCYYNIFQSSDVTPRGVAVSNDAEGYEIKSAEGFVDRVSYTKWRQLVENGLEGRVGHQHILHGWPQDPAKRRAIAPFYMELFDAGSWFLYFRQLNRNPNHVDSVLTHPYLGVYTRPMLDRLHRAVVEGRPENFRERFRMIAAKNFPARPGQASDGLTHIPDCELRSGNKGICRDFMMDMMDARLASGDYSGLRAYNGYEFNAATPTENLFGPFIKGDELTEVLKFEEDFKIPGTHFDIKFNPDPRASNQVRSRLIAPLLPWEKRLDIGYKLAVLKRAQERYAKAFANIATYYNRRIGEVKGSAKEINDLRAAVVERLERINWLFSRRVRLDLDFHRYLMPKPSKMPSLFVENTGSIDVNRIDIGIEFSFRFPERPVSASQAEKRIKAAAESLCAHFGCDPATQIVRKEEGGHGHGLSIRYLVTDADGLKWRVEWDGVQRDYTPSGEPTNPRGGHIETPTPKFSPDNMEKVIALYRGMRQAGNYPSRHAGGAHFNFDLNPLLALTPREGARKFANFIRFFENKKLMLQFLWQHPSRIRVAMPYKMTPNFAKRMDTFNGDWDALGKLLLEEKYYNTYLGRKPSYMQNNVTGAMEGQVPDELKRPIDIKNPLLEWFPSFTGKMGRAELRLIDAPTDEYMAALLIKFGRALMNAGFNGKFVKVSASYTQGDFDLWRTNPKIFFEAAERFLADLGLDPEEFKPLLVESYLVQAGKEVNLKPAAEYELPARGGPGEIF